MTEGINGGGKNGEISRQIPSPLEGAAPITIKLMDSGPVKEKPRTREQITDDLLALVGFLSNEVEKLRVVSGQDNNKEQRLAVVTQLEEDIKTLQGIVKELAGLRPPREL